MQLRSVRILVFAIVACLAGLMPAAAQVTTGNISGVVHDSQGGVIPGATVVLKSETRGTQIAPVVTNEAGVYVFPNVTPDVYTIEITMDSFKTARRAGVRVSGGDRIGVPTVVLEAGGVAETVNVSAEALLVQSQSAERSFAVSSEQIENLPVNRQNFTSLIQFAPGVIAGGDTSFTRLGGQSQNNLMMDGISAMDTGNNGTMLAMNIESIGEVKILTQGYQAEYGRSTGLQVTAVTKSGTNRFRGSVYDIERATSWNSNSWVNKMNGDPKPIQDEQDWGYSLGGPIGKPGGDNKLFFFYSHEYRPRNSPINGGNPIRLRVPTLLERNGDFSQSLDQNGALIPQLKSPVTGQNYPNNVIPSNEFYSLGQTILKRYPEPNKTQTAGTNYNYEVAPPQVENLTQQPAIRIDYQLSSKLRINGKYSGQRARVITQPGLIQGFSDVNTPFPYITNYAATVNYTVTPTTFIEGTYGFIRNELTGGNEGGVLVNESANRLTSLPGFPLIYPNAGKVNNEGYYANEVLDVVKPSWWDSANKLMNLPPTFSWGNRIGAAPPNQRYPGWLNINRTQDMAASITKVMGRHTTKAGFYNNHSFKAQNVGAGGGLSFQGNVDFGQDTNNPIDTGFGYANALTGVFRQYTQASDFIEGQMVYNNTEFYLQDNWKVNSRTTLDYGLRFTHQQPQYDKYQQMSNFFPDQWSQSAAPTLYVPGCSNGAATCTGNTLNAMDPRTGQVVVLPTGNSQSAIGTPVPNSGNLLNGVRRAGDGIADTSYTWPAIVLGPRFGVAYDLNGNQNTILRAGGGLFYDRPDGNTVFSIPGNPPIATSADLRNGTLQSVGQGGFSLLPVPQMVTFQYDAKVPAQWQWQAGMQRALPWAMAIDVSYVGNHGYNRLGALQGGSTVNLNAVDFGAAYLSQNQNTTIASPSSTPGANAYNTNLLKPYRGFANINQNTTDFHDTYHSIQASINRRFRNGFSFGTHYTYGISFKGNTGLQWRLQHNPDGTFQLRSDQADYEKLNEKLDRRPHTILANGVWDLPDVHSLGNVTGYILNGWRLAGVWRAGSGAAYDPSFSYNANGGSVNLTGSPDYGARIVYVGDPGSGCSKDPYKQFNTSAVTGPTYGSVGLESGRNILRGCFDNRTDAALSRDIRMGGNRALEFRLDVFNVFNNVVYTNRQAQVQYNSPTDLTLRNSQTLASGALDPARLVPRNAGFGAATAAQPLRSMQLQIRFAF
jgi:hypothetical protein